MQNDNILISTNKFGGHLSSHHSFFRRDQFFVEPPLEFFSYFKKQGVDAIRLENAEATPAASCPQLSLSEPREAQGDASNIDLSMLSTAQR